VGANNDATESYCTTTAVSKNNENAIVSSHIVLRMNAIISFHTVLRMNAMVSSHLTTSTSKKATTEEPLQHMGTGRAAAGGMGRICCRRGTRAWCRSRSPSSIPRVPDQLLSARQVRRRRARQGLEPIHQGEGSARRRSGGRRRAEGVQRGAERDAATRIGRTFRGSDENADSVSWAKWGVGGNRFSTKRIY
jgi:hypothetical protein